MNGRLHSEHRGLLRHVVLVALLSAGCAGAAATPKPIRYADLGQSAIDLRPPFVIEFQAGDQVPVDFEFSSQNFELSPAHPTMMMVAKQHCFVRFSTDGVRSSVDPNTFDEKPKTPGSFRFGLKVLRGQPPSSTSALPRRSADLRIGAAPGTALSPLFEM